MHLDVINAMASTIAALQTTNDYTHAIGKELGVHFCVQLHIIIAANRLIYAVLFTKFNSDRFRLLQYGSNIAQPIFMVLFTWAIATICGAMLIINTQIVQ